MIYLNTENILDIRSYAKIIHHFALLTLESLHVYTEVFFNDIQSYLFDEYEKHMVNIGVQYPTQHVSERNLWLAILANVKSAFANAIAESETEEMYDYDLNGKLNPILFLLDNIAKDLSHLKHPRK